MPSAQPVITAQTLKQAKAAFKARTRPALSEREQKRLERQVELDERAQRLKLQERKRAEGLKRRQEKEGDGRERVILGSRRRCDRFGHESSQMHLGAFFGRGAGGHKIGVTGEEMFGDDGLDDKTMLDVLRSPKPEGRERHVEALTRSMLVPDLQVGGEPVAALRALNTMAPAGHDDSGPWCGDFELESSTQIARELAADGPEQGGMRDENNATGSFNYGDFDLTMEDLENLEPRRPSAEAANTDRILMPPPALPVKKDAQIRQPSNEQCSFVDLGCTASQLASLFDDDVELTQAAPG